jgi:linoleoyl-CoA desaturase
MIQFEQEAADGFYFTLRQRVASHLKSNPEQRHFGLYFKATLFVAVFLGSYWQVLYSQYFVFWYALMGFITVPMILNIGHEAVHNAFSPYSNLNAFLANIFNLVGASGLIWKERHVKSHHIYPNILGSDSDIAQNKLARIAKTADYIPAHRFQHIYMPGLYLIYTLNWLLYRDFKDAQYYFSEREDGRRQWVWMLLSKGFFFFYALLLPILMRPESWYLIFGGFLIMQFVLSITVFLVLVSAHVGEDAIFPAPDAFGRIGHSWAAHQIITTKDFVPDNWLITHLFGGFNHHAVHHLFPQVSHVYYPEMTTILRQTSMEFGLLYQYFPSVTSAIVSHFKLLKNNAVPPNLWYE